MSVKSYIKSMFVCLLAAAGMASCTKDPGTERGAENGDAALVKLSIYTPSSSVPKARSATADESIVSNIKLIVLQSSGGEYRYRYMVDGRQIVQSAEDSQITTFNALLTSSDVPLKILLVANYNDAFASGDILVDMNEQEVKELLNESFNHDIEGYLPVYGEISLPQLKADQPNSFSVTMLRAVARVDVNNTIDREVSDNFALESVYIYRANDRYAIVPDASAFTTEGKMSVNAASVPSGASVYGAYHKTVGTAGEASIIKSYLPESLPVAEQTLRTSTATCVVVGGYYADDTTPSYYRIDFDSGYEGHPFGQVLRNHKYIFNIMQVNHRGWPTPDDAAENEATAILATMQIWDELTSEMWFSGDDHYLGISSRRIVLDYMEGSEKTEILQATVPFSIQPFDGDTPSGPAITTAGQSFTTDFYKLELEKDTTDGEDVWRLVITSTGDNYTDSQFYGEFKVFTDWWTFDVEVIQDTYVSQRLGKYVKILTITDLDGDLGTTDGTFSDVSGSAMRKVLENTENFSPTGTVIIGGIIVYDLRNTTISNEDASNMYILQKVLSDVDVVHLPGDCTPSSKAAQLIEEWHRAKASRVLIIGLDTPDTNANLIDYIYEVEDTDPEDPSSGTWEINTTVRQLARSFDDDGTERFFNGPFGYVNTGYMGLTKEGGVGYNNGYNWFSTVSIVMIEVADDNRWMMTHGVNTEDGIFYCGDSGVTRNKGTAMSAQAAANGTVKSDFDRLMSNVWAWIVERAAMVSGTANS